MNAISSAREGDTVGSKTLYFEGLGRCYFRLCGKRRPLKGEFYLSGAIVEAYKAPNDLPSEYWIAVPTYKAVPHQDYRKGEAI